MAKAWGVLPSMLRDLPADDLAFNVACYRAHHQRRRSALLGMKVGAPLTPTFDIGDV